MPRAALSASVRDEALPALAQALDPRIALPFVAEAAGHPLRPGLACQVEVLKHSAGRRCTIRYTLVPDGGAPAAAVIGKLYAGRDTAARMYRRLELLSRHVFAISAPLRAPASLLLVPDLALVLQEHVAGVDLRHTLSPGNTTPASLAAQWLAALHAAPPLPETKATSLEHELARVGQWCEEMLPHLPNRWATTLAQLRDDLAGLARRLPGYPPAMIHRDFYYANLLWDGRQVWGVDFDQLRLGDPALDVGHFLAHLQTLAYRTTGDATAYTEQADVFLHSYLEHAPAAHAADLAPRLTFYRTQTFVKLAATAVRRQRPGWRPLAQALVDLACRAAAASDN